MKARKTISYVFLMLAAFGWVLAFSGCVKKESQKYGQEILNPEITKVEAILTEPRNFEDKTVTVQGTIIRECPTGCWFELKEGSAIIYVDLNPSGFAIPQKVGKKIKVEGKVLIRDNKPILTGKGVELK